MLQEYQKTQCRIHMGEPVAGISGIGAITGWRFYEQVGLLEYRMNNLQPSEEARLLGLPISTVGVAGNPHVGDVLTFGYTQNGVTNTITYTVVSGDTTVTIVENVANLVNAASFGIVAAGAPGVKEPFVPFVVNPNAQVISYSYAQVPFTVTANSTGQTVVFVAQQGNFTFPQVTFNDQNTVGASPVTVYGYLNICDYLQSRMGAVSDNLSVAQVGQVTLRSDELVARYYAYTYWRNQLSDFFGVPLFPTGSGNKRGGGGLVI
jgi:hypothetical protein